jgi:hypothetical protein
MAIATNITFTILIKVNGRLREFNFRKRKDLFYDTDTNDERDNRYTFRMVKENEKWKIIGSEIPAWIFKNEELIAESLENYLAGNKGN